MSESRATQSIDEVIDRLTVIVNSSRDARSRLGYFAALYRKVTMQVREGILNGHFEDARRMERFDVIFANRYLEAHATFQRGGSPSRVWAFAFENAGAWWPIVLQHLLLGMNAHINLDLGIAAAQTMKGGSLEDLQGDFNRINGILASLVDDVQNELARVWTMLRVFNRLLGSVEDGLIEFSMTKAREEAWRSAGMFWSIPEADWPSAIDAQDNKMMRLARLVRSPGILAGMATRIVRAGEVQDVRRVIDILK